MALDEEATVPDRVAHRRRQILDAAYQVFATKGYTAATIADVAQALKLGHGTIYRYFENKLDLFMAVVGEILTRLAQVIAGEDPRLACDAEAYREQVVRIGQRMIGLLDDDPAVTKILFYEAFGISAEIDEQIQLAWETAGKFTEMYLVNGKRRGFLRQDLDVEITALSINALIFEAGRRIVRASDRECARERWLSAIVKLIFEGVVEP